MNAELTWQTWRKILREDAYYNAVLAGDDGIGATEQERAILREYIGDLRGVRWGVTTYRFRLVSSALHALETGAPLTRRVMEANGLDARSIAESFSEAQGRRDTGPYTNTTGVAFLDYLQTRFGDLHGLSDVMALERGALQLLIDLSNAPDSTWAPGPTELPAEPGRCVLAPTGRARVVRTKHVLTSWLTDKRSLGQGQLPEREQVFVVYLRSKEEPWRLAQLDHVALIILEGCPDTYDGLRGRLRDAGIDASERLDDVASKLLRWGVLRLTPGREEGPKP